MSELQKYLKNNPHQGFESKARYNELDDSIERIFKDAPCHAEWVDDELTLYRCDKTNEIKNRNPFKFIHTLLHELGHWMICKLKLDEKYHKKWDNKL